MQTGKRVEFADLLRVGPGTLGGRYWRRIWHPIYRISDLPPGRAVPLTILGEKFTLYRGTGGAGRRRPAHRLARAWPAASARPRHALRLA